MSIHHNIAPVSVGIQRKEGVTLDPTYHYPETRLIQRRSASRPD